MTVNDLTIGVVGSGGDGAVSVGEILISAAATEGLYCFMTKSFGAQIKGGESSARVRMCQEPVLTQGDGLNILVAFNWDDFAKFEAEMTLREGCVVLYDSKDTTAAEDIPVDQSLSPILYPIPFDQIAKDTVKTSLAKNVVALDIDKQAIKASDQNVIHNDVSHIVTTSIGTINDISTEKRYQIIFANISSKIIIDILPKIGTYLDATGKAILCGIVFDRKKEIEKHIKDNGFIILDSIISEEWVCFSVSKYSQR